MDRVSRPSWRTQRAPVPVPRPRMFIDDRNSVDKRQIHELPLAFHSGVHFAIVRHAQPPLNHSWVQVPSLSCLPSAFLKCAKAIHNASVTNPPRPLRTRRVPGGGRVKSRPFHIGILHGPLNIRGERDGHRPYSPLLESPSNSMGLRTYLPASSLVEPTAERSGTRLDRATACIPPAALPKFRATSCREFRPARIRKCPPVK